tara:strand:- start:232 stop:741 length:510 start_codon:yes stop_codon:yes gene_type:complete
MVTRKQNKVLVKGIVKKSPKVDFQRFTDEAHQKRRVEEHKLIHWLRDNSIPPAQALGIIERAVNTKTTGHRFNWKMMRFTLYIWARVEEHKTLVMKPKIDTVRELVSTPKYKRLWETFPQSNSFSHEREVKNLAQLISEPRQQIYFKSDNFLYEGTKKNIPQPIIDKIK